MPSFKAFAQQAAKARELQGQAVAAASASSASAAGGALAAGAAGAALPATDKAQPAPVVPKAAVIPKAAAVSARPLAPQAAPAAASPSPSSPAGDEGSSSSRELKIGAPVRICNLMARPELNGLEGVLTAHDKERDRWQVELKSGGAKLFKPGNIERYVPERNAMDVLKGRSKPSPAAAAAQPVSAQRVGKDVSQGGASPAPARSAVARPTAPPGAAGYPEPAPPRFAVPPGAPATLAAASPVAMAVAPAPAGGLVAPMPATTQKAVATQAAAAVEDGDGAEEGHVVAGDGEVAKKPTLHIHPPSEDDDDAFFKSIELCLKECDVMWDDYGDY